jgi:hypothetical protein
MISGELINTKPCAGPGPCAFTARSIYGSLYNTGGTLAGSANMAAWIAAYDMTQIPWGATLYVVFNDYTDTEPEPFGAGGTPDGGHTFSRTDYWSSQSQLFVSPTNDIIRSEVWIGAPRPFMVLAIGFTTGAGSEEISVAGCTFTFPTYSSCGSLTVELPIPNAALGDYCFEYLFALQGTPTGSGPDYGGPFLSVAQMASELCNNYAPTWNPNRVCAPLSGDPFAS